MKPGTMTSSPGPMPRPSSVIHSAARAAAVEGEGVLDAGQLGDLLLDVAHLGAEGGVVGRPVAAEVAALEDLHHLGGLLGSDQLDPGSGHGRLPRYWMSIRCSRRFLS